MLQKALLPILICYFAMSTCAGAKTVDSLKQVLIHTTNDTGRIDLLIAISLATPTKDSTSKLKFAFDALDLAKNEVTGKYLMDCFENIGRIYCYALQNYPKAINYFQQYENCAKRHNDSMRQIIALGNLLVAHKLSSAFAKGLDCGNRALQLRPSPEIESGLLCNMGIIYLNAADYPKAMEYYTRSLKAAEQAIINKKAIATEDDTMSLALLLLSIGDIHGKMKEYSNAIENYNKAIAITRERPSIMAVSLMGKGTIYEGSGDYVESIKMYNKALDINKQRLHDDNETKIVSSLARLHIKTADIPTARKYANTALTLARHYNEEALLPDIYIILAKLDEHGGKRAHAVAYLLDAVKKARKIGLLETESEALQMLSETYKAMSRYREALDAHEHYIAIRDSIYNIDNAKKITRMDIDMEYGSKRLSDSVKNAQQTAIYKANIQKQRVINFSAFTVVGLLAVLSFFIYRNYTQQKKATVAISKARDEIQEEKIVSEGLLLNILPEEVAKELKTRGDVEPKLFENVTVFFSDFVNFTIAGDKLGPQQLVAELHECFKAFDAIMSKYGIEKIKTVGDAYLAAAGVPQPNANHADDIVKAALEVRDFMRERKKLVGDRTFGIRIGINSGPVVAGIVGVRKFAYDIWGDTVNVAARMEQHSEDGKVNISEKTHQLLTGDFSLTDRGTIDVKNKGAMRMYFAELT